MVGLKAPVVTDSQIELIKVIAVVLMLIDHMGIIFPELTPVLEYIGRPVFPLFAFIVAYHYVYHTKNKMAYMLRMLAFALISEGPYRSAMELLYPHADMYFLNILFSIALGLAVLQWIELIRDWPEKYSLPLKWLTGFLGFLIFATLSFFVEYMFFGIAMIVAMYYWILEPTQESHNAAIFFTFLLNIVGGLVMAASGLSAFLIVAIVMQLKAIKMPRINGTVYYLFYPAHFFLLYQLGA
jgi:hypothetical protein